MQYVVDFQLMLTLIDSALTHRTSPAGNVSTVQRKAEPRHHQPNGQGADSTHGNSEATRDWNRFVCTQRQNFHTVLGRVSTVFLSSSGRFRFTSCSGSMISLGVVWAPTYSLPPGGSHMGHQSYAAIHVPWGVVRALV